MADDPRPLLHELAASDRRGAVWCAALCAQSVLHLVPEGEDRPSRAVRLALEYGSGVEISAERMRSASYDASAASDVYAAASAASRAAAAASRAASYAVSRAAAAYAASRAAAAAAGSAASGDAWDAAYDTALARMSALVRGQLDPAAPTPEDVQRARTEAQVAWDWLLEHSPDPVRVGSLGDALDRARRLGLRWECPVERALAERGGKHQIGRLRAVLGGEE